MHSAVTEAEERVVRFRICDTDTLPGQALRTGQARVGRDQTSLSGAQTCFATLCHWKIPRSSSRPAQNFGLCEAHAHTRCEPASNLVSNLALRFSRSYVCHGARKHVRLRRRAVIIRGFTGT